MPVIIVTIAGGGHPTGVGPCPPGQYIPSTVWHHPQKESKIPPPRGPKPPGAPAKAQQSPQQLFSSVFSGTNIFLALGIAAILTIAVLFNPDGVLRKSKNHHSEDDEDQGSENGFADSVGYFRNICDALGQGDIGPREHRWASDSGSCYSVQNTEFRDLIEGIIYLATEVHTATQTEADQVNQGRATLENTLNGLQLAIPVSESLYFSGPAGPALSYNFQLAIANPSISTGVDTANNMHENSRRHSEYLTTLLEKYNAAFGLVCPAGVAAPVGPAVTLLGWQAANTR